MRQNKYSNLMELAEVIAKRSHDAETKVGAILVSNKTGAILATGYNGFVRGANDQGLPNTRPEKYPYMVHAEENLIANAARHGIAMEDCTIVCTHSPCSKCMRLLFQAGITRLIVKNLYKDFAELRQMLDIKIRVWNPNEAPELTFLGYESRKVASIK